jgi:hypothetical protein
MVANRAVPIAFKTPGPFSSRFIGNTCGGAGGRGGRGDMVRGGTFDPVVDRALPFDRAGESHAFLQDRQNFGKVLLEP